MTHRHALGDEDFARGVAQNGGDIRLILHSIHGMMRRHWLSIIVAALFGAVVWLLVLWQPARQVRRHTEQLLATIERKNWKRLGELMADDYSDSWGHDKSGLIADAREVFAQFFAIELRAHEMVVAESDGSGTAKARKADMVSPGKVVSGTHPVPGERVMQAG